MEATGAAMLRIGSMKFECSVTVGAFVSISRIASKSYLNDEVAGKVKESNGA